MKNCNICFAAYRPIAAYRFLEAGPLRGSGAVGRVPNYLVAVFIAAAALRVGPLIFPAIF